MIPVLISWWQSAFFEFVLWSVFCVRLSGAGGVLEQPLHAWKENSAASGAVTMACPIDCIC